MLTPNSSKIQDFQRQLPAYLTIGQKVEIIDNIRKFPKIEYYLNNYHTDTEFEQGDVFEGVPIYSFKHNEQKLGRVIILSNSCDISPNNKRYTPVNILVASMIKLEDYKSLLLNSNVPQEKVQSRISSIIAQEVTDIFYLPPGGLLESAYIAKFDQVTALPIKNFMDQKPKLLARLSDIGYYLFLFKLSVHFCRFPQEAR